MKRDCSPWPAQTEEAAQDPLTRGLAVVPMDEFLRACGATGPLQLLVENQGLTAMRWDTPRPFALIGRDPAMDLSLDHPQVEGQHAYLQVIEGGIFCVDLGSQAGTRWKGGTSHSGWLSHSERIGIGPYLIRLALDDHEVSASTSPATIRPDPLSSRSQEVDNLPRVILEFRREGAKPIRWRMRHMLTLVGTSPHCKIRLASPGVSPFHCSLLRTSTGMWAVNLLGHEGITVNGSSTRASRLDEDDELRIGEILIRVIYEAHAAVQGEVRLPAGEARGQSTYPTHPMLASRELATSRSPAAWMGPGREAARLLADRVTSEGELPAPLLALVLDQFGQMQQQFLHQFQQTTMMMFRALGTMHRDQMEELREKLDSLHQIGENLRAFQAEISNTVAPDPGSSAPEREDLPPQKLATAGAPAGDTGDRERRGTPPDGTTARETHPAGQNGTTEHLRAKIRSITEEPNIPSLNVHEWLIGRIAALEDEQRTRWQKILDIVRGR
jgi:predicted component of type VI protein secretion system